MKRNEIITEGKAIKEGIGNVRGWCDAIEARVDAMIERLSAPADAPRAEQAPAQIQYDSKRLDEAPRPRQQRLEGDPEVFCNCGDRAKRIEKEGKNGKPYVAYACPNPKSEGCDYWAFENQLQKAG